MNLSRQPAHTIKLDSQTAGPFRVFNKTRLYIYRRSCDPVSVIIVTPVLLLQEDKVKGNPTSLGALSNFDTSLPRGWRDTIIYFELSERSIDIIHDRWFGPDTPPGTLIPLQVAVPCS